MKKLIFTDSGSVNRKGLGELHDAANALRSKDGQHTMGNLSFARILLDHIDGKKDGFVGAAVETIQKKEGQAPSTDSTG